MQVSKWFTDQATNIRSGLRQPPIRTMEVFGCQADTRPTDVVLQLLFILCSVKTVANCAKIHLHCYQLMHYSTSSARMVAKVSTFSAMRWLAPRRLQICQQTALWWDAGLSTWCIVAKVAPIWLSKCQYSPAMQWTANISALWWDGKSSTCDLMDADVSNSFGKNAA